MIFVIYLRVWIEASPSPKYTLFSKGTHNCLMKSLIIMFPVCPIWFQDPIFKWVQTLHLHISSLVQDCINSLRPSDAIWRQWSWTTLAQVMACCLTAPSHYLNQCWLIIRGVLWHTSESSFAGIAQGIDSGYEFEKDILKNIFKSPRGQWVNSSA